VKKENTTNYATGHTMVKNHIVVLIMNFVKTLFSLAVNRWEKIICNHSILKFFERIGKVFYSKKKEELENVLSVTCKMGCCF